MTKITVEMDDTLQETKDRAVEEIVEEFVSIMEQNPDYEDWSDFEGALQDIDHEIADSNTPIYNKEIDDLYYLYSDELEESYRNHGFGDGGEDNHKQVTIYCVILDAIYDAVREIQELFEEWVNDESDDKMTRQQFIEHVKSEVVQ